MSSRRTQYLSASVLCFMLITCALSPSIGSSNIFSSIAKPFPYTQASGSTSFNRTAGIPTSGYWNSTYGTGGLPETVPLAGLAAMSPPPGGLPNRFSWNGYSGGVNYMTPVKNQGSCGSCWAFTGVGGMEAQYQIGRVDPGTGIDLSEQDVLSCSAGTCAGWYLRYTLDFLKSSGTTDEVCCPYVGTKTACGSGRCSNYLSRTWKITGWTWISTDASNIKYYLYAHGPVMVWMPVFSDFPWYDASYWERYFYSHAPSGSYEGHFVIIVGWDDQGSGTGDDYWIAKNSWGTSGGDVNWGYGGYFYMTQNPTNGFFGIYQEAAVISGVTPPTQMKGTTRIALDASPKPGFAYQSVTISGTLYGSLRSVREGVVVGKAVQIVMGWGPSITVITDLYGQFSFKTTCPYPPGGGTKYYSITATFYEDQDFFGCSTTMTYEVIGKIPTSISISYAGNREFGGYLRRLDTGAYLAYKPVKLTVTYLYGSTWRTDTFDLQTRHDGYWNLEFLFYWNSATVRFDGDETYASSSATITR